MPVINAFRAGARQYLGKDESQTERATPFLGNPTAN
jgi:hypothetical protein